MSTAKRTLRDVGALAAATLAVGASFGAITIAYALPAWVPIVMSVLIFAGGAQFLAVGLLAAGNPLAAVLAGLLLNARHLPFGMAVADTIGTRPRDRLVGSHLMTDETVAFALAEPDPVRRRHVYWTVGATLFVTWNTGVLLGVLLGGATGDPNTLGLDAAFPAGLIALILPSLRDRDTRLVALAGAAIAVLLTPLLPAGLPVLCALLGLLTLLRPRPAPRAPTPGLPDRPTAEVPGSAAAPRGGSAGAAVEVPGSAAAPRAGSAGAAVEVPGSAAAPRGGSAGAGAEVPDRALSCRPAGTTADASTGCGSIDGSVTEETQC